MFLDLTTAHKVGNIICSSALPTCRYLVPLLRFLPVASRTLLFHLCLLRQWEFLQISSASSPSFLFNLLPQCFSSSLPRERFSEIFCKSDVFLQAKVDVRSLTDLVRRVAPIFISLGLGHTAVQAQ